MNNKFGGGNIQQLMKQAQQMQLQIQKAQEELEQTEIEGVSGNGLVTVVLNGHKKFLSLKIDPKAVDIDDLEMLEDLIIAAYNEAAELAEEEREKLMPSGAGGLL